MKRTILLVLVLALGMATKVAKADFTFGTPVQLSSNVNSSAHDFRPSITGDGLSLYFSSNRHSASLDFDIYVSTRTSVDEPWGQAIPVGAPINTSTCENSPCISSDGLSLFFDESAAPFVPPRRPDGYGSGDIWVTTRPTKDAPWSEPTNLGPAVNTVYGESTPELSADGLSLFFASDRPGSYGGPYSAFGLWVTTRPTKDAEWSAPVNLGPDVNTGAAGTPSISADGLHLFFHSNRPPSTAAHAVDLYVTSRQTISDPWGPPLRLGPPINTVTSWEAYPCISPDSSVLYFVADDWPGMFSYYDIWYAPIIPMVDINVDGIVDSADMCILVNHWGENHHSCDIGPTPLGDGVVDTQDLIVLASHLFEEIPLPFELAAYWRLDETGGDVAHETISDADAVVMGDPLWQPTGGKVAGALELDGIDDYVSTPFVWNPSTGPFSIFAWIKGGAPGQVIISQSDGSGGSGDIWLSTDPLDGRLMTSLTPPAAGRSTILPLESESIITDGQWHHIGVAWNNQSRSLYVDGLEVARDSQPLNPLKPSDGGLYIGVGKSLDTGSFFSGLIDDVRIHDVALSTERIEALAH